MIIVTQTKKNELTAHHPLSGAVLTIGRSRADLCNKLARMGWGHWYLRMPGAALSVLIVDHTS